MCRALSPSPLALVVATLSLTLPPLPGETSPAPRIREVSIDAMHRPALPGVRPLSYRLRCGNPEIDLRSLRHREAARHVQTALSGHGLYEAPAKVRPDLIIEMDYGIESSGLRYEKVTVPVYARSSHRPHLRPRSGSRTSLSPSLGTTVIGYREITCPVATREKYLALSARLNRDHADHGAAPEVWRIRASIDDERSDLRTCLPLLAFVAMEKIGENTGGATTLSLAENEPEISFIRAGL